MILHGYFRSGTSYRTRIGLNLKGLAYESRGIDLRTGAQASADYLALNPQGLVPALETQDDVLVQSPAILEWLEERHPTPPLMPDTPAGRATVRAMAAIIGCDVHPLNNLRVLKALRSQFEADQAAVDAWAGRWITPGFQTLETLVGQHGHGWAYGDTPGLVDCYLIPQIYSARRFNVPLDAFPRLLAIDEAAAEHPAFVAARPENQPDAD